MDQDLDRSVVIADRVLDPYFEILDRDLDRSVVIADRVLDP